LPTDNDYTDINLLPTDNLNTDNLNTDNLNTNSSGIQMKDELKSFLKKQLNSSNEIPGLDQGYSFGSSF
jgi:hypothetical protein